MKLRPSPRRARAAVLAAVARDGVALQFVSAALRADRAVVLAAVAQRGWALQWARLPLRAEWDVVLDPENMPWAGMAFKSIGGQRCDDHLHGVIARDSHLSCTNFTKLFNRVKEAAAKADEDDDDENDGTFEIELWDLRITPESLEPVKSNQSVEHV